MSSENNERGVIATDPNEALIKLVRPDTVLIGVNHGVDIASLPTPPTRFKTSIQTADQLILESPRSSYEKDLASQRASAKFDYEGFAFSDFFGRNKSEDVHYLEEGVDHTALAAKYGLPDRIFVLGDQAPYISDAVEMSRDHPELLAAYLQGVVSDLRGRSAALNNLPEGELEGWIGGLAAFARSNLTDPDIFTYRRQHNYLREINPSGRMQKLRNVGNLMRDYMGEVRDYEIICPRAEGFSDSLVGRKVVVIGMGHFSNVERVFQGKGVEKPKMWKEHVRSLSMRQRRDVGILQKIPSMPIQ